MLTAAALVVAAAVTPTVRVDETPPSSERERLWPELTGGVRHIRGLPMLARLTATMAVVFAVSGLSNSAIFAAIDDGLGRDSSFVGVLAAIQGGGSVLGGITAAAVVHRLGETAASGTGLAMLALGLGAVAAPTTPTLLAAALVVGVAVPWTMVAFVTIRQRLTPGELQGRVARHEHGAQRPADGRHGRRRGADHRRRLPAARRADGSLLGACVLPPGRARSESPEPALTTHG